MLAEVSELERDELSRGGRHEHLAGMTCRGYAGRAVDIGTDIALVSEKGCPRVQTHTYLNGAGGKRLGHLFRCGDCARRGRECEEEGIALRVDFDAVVTGASFSDQAAMPGECLRIALGAELVEQPRRTRDVGEEEGDRSGREITPHRRHHASKQAVRVADTVLTVSGYECRRSLSSTLSTILRSARRAMPTERFVHCVRPGT